MAKADFGSLLSPQPSDRSAGLAEICHLHSSILKAILKVMDSLEPCATWMT